MCFISYAKFPGVNKHNFNEGKQANAAEKWYHKERKRNGITAELYLVHLFRFAPQSAIFQRLNKNPSPFINNPVRSEWQCTDMNNAK